MDSCFGFGQKVQLPSKLICHRWSSVAATSPLQAAVTCRYGNMWDRTAMTFDIGAPFIQRGGLGAEHRARTHTHICAYKDMHHKQARTHTAER